MLALVGVLGAAAGSGELVPLRWLLLLPRPPRRPLVGVDTGEDEPFLAACLSVLVVTVHCVRIKIFHKIISISFNFS